MTEINPVFDFAAWVDEHAHLLRPPVNNRVMWERTGDFLVQVVGGPNERTDFHVDPYEEWFYQLRGDMHVNIRTDKGIERVDIAEGGMWLLPRDIPHSPQRPQPGSIGIVVERIREEGTLERFQWYCPACEALVHETELQVRDLVVDLPPVFQEFYDSEQARTCPQCAAVHPGRKPA